MLGSGSLTRIQFDSRQITPPTNYLKITIQGFSYSRCREQVLSKQEMAQLLQLPRSSRQHNHNICKLEVGANIQFLSLYNIPIIAINKLGHELLLIYVDV